MKTAGIRKAVAACAGAAGGAEVLALVNAVLIAERLIFASPHQVGKLPWSYDQVWRVYQKAAKAAGIGQLGTHSMRTRIARG